MSKNFVIRRISHIGRYFGMISSRKILGKSLKEARREVVKRTWLLLVRKEWKGNTSSKKCKSDGGSSQPGKKKNLRKIECFSCHENGHYAS